MTKRIKATVKLHIPAGKATPAPPIGPSLAQHGVNISAFCQQFNDVSKSQEGFTVPVEVTIYEDRSFDFRLKTPLTSELIKKSARPLGEAPAFSEVRPEGRRPSGAARPLGEARAGIEKGSGEPNRKKVGKITKAQLREIAQKKMADLNTKDIDQAMKIVEGTAKNMGIIIE